MLYRNFFLFFLLIFILSNRAFAAQTGIVISKRAIIYADMEKTVPLGYVSRGKRLLVGEVTRKLGNLLPIVVSGKVAYIQVKDLKLQKITPSEVPPKQRPHALAYKVEIKDDPKKDNFVTFSFNQYDLGSNWDSIADRTGENPKPGYSFKLMIEHRPLKFRYSWGIRMGYYGVLQSNVYFRSASIEPVAAYSIFKQNLITIDLVGAAIFMPFFNITNELALVEQDQGNLWGYSFGTELRLFPYSKYSIFGGIVFQALYPRNIKPIIVEQETLDKDDIVVTTRLGKMTGINLLVGISYQL